MNHLIVSTWRRPDRCIRFPCEICNKSDRLKFQVHVKSLHRERVIVRQAVTVGRADNLYAISRHIRTRRYLLKVVTALRALVVNNFTGGTRETRR